MKKIIFIVAFMSNINAFAQTWSAVSNGVDNDIYSQAIYNGELIAGGAFYFADGILCNNLAKWNGNNWDTLPGVIGTDNVSTIEANNSELYVGRGAPPFIFKYDGSNWSTLGSGLNNVPIDFIIYNSELYAGGSFTNAGGISANRIAKWDGSSWSNVGTGMNDDVLCLGIYNGELYAGGRFTIAGSNAANYIAKWNGSNWVPLGTGLSDAVYSMKVYNGNLYVGGLFATAGGIPSFGIASWNGSSWNTVAGGITNGFGVISLEVYNSELYAGGYFSSIGGISANSIARWNDVNWSALGTTTNGISGVANDLKVYNNELYVGGTFDSAGTVNVNNIARWFASTGINNNNSNISVSLTPNPFTNEFILKGTKNTGMLILFDLSGKEILRQNSTDNETKILTPSLLPGCYIVKYEEQTKFTNFKIVKF